MDPRFRGDDNAEPAECAASCALRKNTRGAIAGLETDNGGKKKP